MFVGNFYTPFYVDILFSGRYAPIFCFYCEHFLFVYIVKQKQKSSSKFNANRILLCGKVFEILIIQKPSHGSYEVPHKIWAQSVQPFWRLLDTNKQTDTQTSKVYLYINLACLCALICPRAIRTFSHTAVGYQDLSGYQDRLSEPSRSQ